MRTRGEALTRIVERRRRRKSSESSNLVSTKNASILGRVSLAIWVFALVAGLFPAYIAISSFSAATFNNSANIENIGIGLKGLPGGIGVFVMESSQEVTVDFVLPGAAMNISWEVTTQGALDFHASARTSAQTTRYPCGCKQQFDGVITSQEAKPSGLPAFGNGECASLPDDQAYVLEFSAGNRSFRSAGFNRKTMSFPFFIVPTSSLNAFTPDPYEPPPQIFCELASVPSGYDVASATPNPSGEGDNPIAWTNQGIGVGPRVVFQASDFEEIQNFCLIAAGLMFALVAGFVPLWVQESVIRWRVWPRFWAILTRRIRPPRIRPRRPTNRP